MSHLENTRIAFTVYGAAQTAGSKRSFVPLHRTTKQPFRNRRGGIVVSTIDDNPKGKDWKAAIAMTARNVYRGPLLDCAVSVTMRFYRPRPKGHFGKNGLNATGRESHWPTTKPDVLKLARCAEDALTGVVWRDDAQIVFELIEKLWGEPARMEIEIEPASEVQELLFQPNKRIEQVLR